MVPLLIIFYRSAFLAWRLSMFGWLSSFVRIREGAFVWPDGNLNPSLYGKDSYFAQKREDWRRSINTRVAFPPPVLDSIQEFLLSFMKFVRRGQEQTNIIKWSLGERLAFVVAIMPVFEPVWGETCIFQSLLYARSIASHTKVKWPTRLVIVGDFEVCLACHRPCFGVTFFWVRKSLVATLSVLTTNRDPPPRSQVVHYCCHLLLLDRASRSHWAFGSHMLLGYLIVLAHRLWHSLTHPCVLQMA